MCDLSGEDIAKWQESNRLDPAFVVPRIQFRSRASLISTLLDNASCRLLEEREQYRVTLNYQFTITGGRSDFRMVPGDLTPGPT